MAVTLVGVFAAWEIAVRAFGLKPYVLPAPSLVFENFLGQWARLLEHAWVTTEIILVGYVLGILVAIPLALLIAFSRTVQATLYPLLVVFQIIPKIAVAPLFIVWFGFGLMPKVLIAFLIAFFPIVINTVVGLAGIEPEKILLARSMGLSGTATFFKIRLPNALPSIFGGLKIAITLAVVGAVVGEFVGGDAGLGYLLMSANGSMDTPLLFAGLVGLTLIGVVLFMLIEIAERFAIPWHTSARNTAAGESL